VKRVTVKAWGLVLIRPDGTVKLPPDFVSPTRECARAYREDVIPRGYCERVVPVTITFDEVRPARARQSRRSK
jgi:hypothetical protein